MWNDPALLVFWYAMLTAIATGLGALPFFFVKKIPDKWLGWSAAAASGIMLAASFQLIYEGLEGGVYRVLLGIIIGLVFILLSHRWLSAHQELSIGNLTGADALQSLLIVGVMTLHSFAEGVGVGVAFGETEEFGAFISAAIAIHNIPEGLAISLVLIPKGVKVWKAMLLSIASSLPQPLIAVPSFWFVTAFQPWLATGLGLAAGAMIWMVGSELLPEALEKGKKEQIASILTVSAALMVLFQYLLSG